MTHNNDLFLTRVEFNAKFAFLKEQLDSKREIIEHYLSDNSEYNEAETYYTETYITEAELLIKMYNAE